MSKDTPNPNTTDSELDKILAEHWSDLLVVESGSPGTRSNAHRKAKRRLEALIAAKVEEARIDEMMRLRNAMTGDGIHNGDLMDYSFDRVHEIKALQSKEGDSNGIKRTRRNSSIM